MKIFPVYYFPSVSWFAAAVHEKTIVLEKYQHFRKQHFFNRMEILVPNKTLKLSIPIKKAGERTPIGERQILNDWVWRKDHWKSIESALRSSPYFEFFEDQIHPFYSQTYDSLFDFNLAIITMVRDALRLDFDWTISEMYLPSVLYTGDYREGFYSKTGEGPAWFDPKPYSQVFGETFAPDLSILDLMCNKGMETEMILKSFYKELE